MSSYADAYNLWIQAGGPAWAAPVAAAIAGAESSFGANPFGDRTNPSDWTTSTSFGMWQIHTPAHPQYDPVQLVKDPLYNAKAAVDIFNAAGQNFTPWSTFTNHSYLQFLPSAASASASDGSGPTFSNAPTPSTTSAVGTSAPTFAPVAMSQQQTTLLIFFVGALLLLGAWAVFGGHEQKGEAAA